MSEQETRNNPIEKVFNLSLRLGIYGTCSFLTCFSVVMPSLAFLALCSVTGYFIYLIIDTAKAYIKLKQMEIRDALKASIIMNSQEFLYFVLAIIVGVFLGVI